MKNIFLVTHPESIHHVENKVGGWYDTSLTERGRHQAQQIAARLEVLIQGGKSTITASDLLRTKETADVIGKRFGCPVSITEDLRELSYGPAEGKPQAWLDGRLNPAPENDRLDHRNIDGAESKREFITRIYRAVEQIVSSEQQNHIVVTHGFAMTFVIACWIKLPIEAAGHVNFRASSGGITHLQEDDFFRNRGVRFVNDVSHIS
ncbi:MAG: histidine phosphatase family protein [Pseudomonadota bacterium]